MQRERPRVTEPGASKPAVAGLPPAGLVAAGAGGGAEGRRAGGVEAGDDAAASGGGELAVRGHHPRVHDVDDAARAAVATVELPVEGTSELVDPVEVPEQRHAGVVAAATEPCP